MAVDTEREGRANDVGRLFRWEEPVPVRGLRPPWNADIACGFKNGIGGPFTSGESGLEGDKGVRRPDMYSKARWAGVGIVISSSSDISNVLAASSSSSRSSLEDSSDSSSNDQPLRPADS